VLEYGLKFCVGAGVRAGSGADGNGADAELEARVGVGARVTA
jgi:hypothetical protein